MSFNPLLAAAMGGGPMMPAPMGPQMEGVPVPPEQLAPGMGPDPGQAQMITMPDTLEASLANANKHLIKVARGLSPMNEDAVAPQLQSLTVLIRSVMDRKKADGNTPPYLEQGDY